MTRRYPVQPRARGLILGAVFFAACAIVLLHQATHAEGMILDSFIELGPASARIVLLVLAALSLGFVGVALTVLVRRRVKELLITEQAIILDARAIRFDEVRIVEEQNVYGQVFLTVLSEAQKLSIAKSHLPDGAYEEVVALVRSRVRRS